MDPAEQGDHTAPTDHHSQDRNDPSLRPPPPDHTAQPPSLTAPPQPQQPRRQQSPVHVSQQLQHHQHHSQQRHQQPHPLSSQHPQQHHHHHQQHRQSHHPAPTHLPSQHHQHHPHQHPTHHPPSHHHHHHHVPPPPEQQPHHTALSPQPQHPQSHQRPDRQPMFHDTHRRQMHMHMQQQQQPQQTQSPQPQPHHHQHMAQARASGVQQHQGHSAIDSRQRFSSSANVMMGMHQSPQHQISPSPPQTTISRTTSAIVPPVAGPGPPQTTGAGSSGAHGGPSSSSTSKLWEHFMKGEKMQKTNKFYAHCIYCRKVDRNSSTRGERRMMSAHLSTCSEAPEPARAEGLTISKELKFRRSMTGFGRKVRGSSVAPGGPVGGVGVSGMGGVSMSSVGKRVRRSASLHAAIGQSSAGGSQEAMLAAAAAVAAATTGHSGGGGESGGGGGGGGSHTPYFDTGLGRAMTDVVQQGRVVTSDNVRLYYEECGTGHPLILIHGLSGSCKYFDSNFRELALRFRVIRFDLRGHGDSDKPEYGFHVHRLAADLHDLVDHFSFDRVALLGCSLGCAVIWAFVELYGVSQISAAMFVDQSPYQMMSPDGMWRYGSRTIFSEGSLTHVCAELTKNPRAYHEENVRAGFTRTPSTMEMTTYVNESLKSAVWFTAKLMVSHSYMDWRAVLPLVSCPALVIAGKKSKAFPWEGVAYAAENMPHAKLIPFEEGSHWLYIEEAVRFNSTVAAFLQSIVSGS